MEVDPSFDDVKEDQTSPDMFPGSPQEETDSHKKDDISCNEDEKMSTCETDKDDVIDSSWRGVPLEDLRQGCGRWGPPPPVPVIPSSQHTVLFKLPVKPGRVPEPHPTTPQDRWDQEHVRMPNSSESLYPVHEADGEKGLRVRWEVIQEALLRSIMSSKQLEAAILSYNSRYIERWDFCALHNFFNGILSEDENDIFFRDVFPKMVELALQLPHLVTGPIPLLRTHQSHSISLSQLQIASLLANAFFCTFPRRNTSKRGSEYAAYPDINFSRLFQAGNGDGQSSNIMEKLKCILNYFRRVSKSPPEGVVTYCRRYRAPGTLPNWGKSTNQLPRLHISSSGFIEDGGSGMLQVDFANRYVGGGVLGWGCVQEEIRFVICPELIASRLFTECLDATEALLIVGCERFSAYSGYGDSFEWTADFRDSTVMDSYGRRHCTIVALDALHFTIPGSQYSLQNIVRELNKAYVGFYEPDRTLAAPSAAVATGNWGCGAFRGDAHLKALIQLMAAAECGRPLVYFTFGNTSLRDRIYQMHTFLTEKNVTVGQMWNLLCDYSRKCAITGKVNTPDLYQFIYKTLEEQQDLSQEIAPNKIMVERKKTHLAPTEKHTELVRSNSLTEAGLSVDDLEKLIECADSEPEDDVVAPEPESSKKLLFKSSVSCLDLIEKGLGNPTVTKTNSLPRTNLLSWNSNELLVPTSHEDCKKGRDSVQQKKNCCVPSSSRTTPSKETFEHNSSGLESKSKCLSSDNLDQGKVGSSHNVGQPKSPVISESSEPQSRPKSAQKRKISDYFSIQN